MVGILQEAVPKVPSPSRKLPHPPSGMAPDSMLVPCLHDTGLQAAFSLLGQLVQWPLSAPPRVCAIPGHLSSHRTNAPDGALHTDCPLPTTPGRGPDLLTQQPLGSPCPLLWGLCQGTGPVDPQPLLDTRKLGESLQVTPPLPVCPPLRVQRVAITDAAAPVICSHTAACDSLQAGAPPPPSPRTGPPASPDA